MNRCFLGLGASPLSNIVRIVGECREVMDAYAARYCRTESDRFSVISTFSESRIFEYPYSPEDYICHGLMREAEELVVHGELSKTPFVDSDPDVKAHGLRAFAAHMVRLGGNTVGCLSVFEKESYEYSDADLNALGMLARALSIEEERKAHEEDLKNFIDIASHELRHPVTIIKGYAQTLHELERQMDESTRTEVLQAIEKGADRLNSLVLELLDVSRIERGRFGLEKELVELKPLIENAVAEVGGKYRNNEFNLEIRGELGKRWIDAEKIKKLLVILLDNAASFSLTGSAIEVEAAVVEGEVVISVTDRGQGVSEEEREIIFERFYQVEDALHHSSPGIGLGLYIAREIAEAHGGSIWHEHREGGGSIFRFTIP
ncbi:MAG: sensor histidine kinase [Actinomycetota bacterium]